MRIRRYIGFVEVIDEDVITTFIEFPHNKLLVQTSIKNNELYSGKCVLDRRWLKW